MPSLLSSLIALSLVAQPAPGTMPSFTPASHTVQAAVAAPAPKARSTATRAKRGAKAAPTPKAAIAPKTAKPADCDTPKPEAAAKVAATTPVPVAADPLAPTLAPCAESKPRS